MIQKEALDRKSNILNYCLSIIFLLSFFTNSAYCELKVPREEKKREKYYNKIINESVQDAEAKKIELMYDKEGFYIRNTGDYLGKESLAFIEKKNVISGCEFFPFRDYLTGLIVKYCNNNLRINRDVSIPLFTLVYNMLYKRFGDKDRSYIYYSKKLKMTQSDEFNKYELSDEVKEYMLNMPVETGNTSFYFSDSELEYARKHGLSLFLYDFAMGMFDYVHESIKNIQDEVYRDSIITIVNNREYFKKYSNYAMRKGIHIKVKEYASIYPTSLREDYKNYNSVLSDKFKFGNEICLVLMPVLDLLRTVEHYKAKEDELIRINLNLKPEFGFGLTLDHNFKAGEKLGYMINEIYRPLTKENLFLEYGMLLDESNANNRVNLSYNFKKIDFTPKKAELCKVIGCSGFNIDFLMQNKIEQHEFTFTIDETLNFHLLNIFKIINLEDSKIREFFHLKRLETFTKLENEVEMKAMKEYVKLIRNIFSFSSEIPNELHKMKGLLEDLQIKTSLSDLNLANELTRKYQILKVAAEKNKTILKHLESLYKEFENVINMDLKYFKKNLLVKSE